MSINELSQCAECGDVPELIEEASIDPLTGTGWDRYKCGCGETTVNSRVSRDDGSIHHKQILREIYKQPKSIEKICDYGWIWIGLYDIADPSDPEILSIIKEQNQKYSDSEIEIDALPNHHNWKFFY